MDDPWLRFTLAVLATWRLATLLAHDDGPWDAVLRLRSALGDGAFGRVLDCFRCVSLWVAAPLSFAVGRGPLEWLLAWLALSGAACLLERLCRSALSVQPWNPDGQAEGEVHELLRTEAQGAVEPNVEPAGRRAEDGPGPGPIQAVR
jgi:hypothetical protein